MAKVFLECLTYAYHTQGTYEALFYSLFINFPTLEQVNLEDITGTTIRSRAYTLMSIQLT